MGLKWGQQIILFSTNIDPPIYVWKSPGTAFSHLWTLQWRLWSSLEGNRLTNFGKYGHLCCKVKSNAIFRQIPCSSLRCVLCSCEWRAGDAQSGTSCRCNLSMLKLCGYKMRPEDYPFLGRHWSTYLRVKITRHSIFASMDPPMTTLKQFGRKPFDHFWDISLLVL